MSDLAGVEVDVRLQLRQLIVQIVELVLNRKMQLNDSHQMFHIKICRKPLVKKAQFGIIFSLLTISLYFEMYF